MALAWRDYTTVIALALSCMALSFLTLAEHYPTGAAGGKLLADRIVREFPAGGRALCVVRETADDALFAEALTERLTAAKFSVIATVRGQPADARRALMAAAEARQTIDVIAVNNVTAKWGVFANLESIGEAVKGARVIEPASYRRSTFLKLDNLLNIANQIVIIAILAIGMTLVIIAGGIDLSVGSVVALAAVIFARLVRDLAGGEAAEWLGVGLAGVATIAVCGLLGAFNGLFSTILRIPPFIVTLATMSIASGLAFMVTKGETINAVPQSISWLMRGTPLLGIPNGVALMCALYSLGHIVLSRAVFGRHVYAIGGNRKAAWLCGVPVRRVELATYVIAAALAGVAGVLMVSQYRSGAPTYGISYELQTIAAVVVGGTSLAGGQGRMFGTLLGALLIAVVQNGMNLLNISHDPQKVVLGLVILAAAVLDRFKQSG